MDKFIIVGQVLCYGIFIQWFGLFLLVCVELVMMYGDCIELMVVSIKWVEVMGVIVVLVNKFDFQFKGVIGMLQKFGFIDFQGLIKYLDRWDSCFINIYNVNFIGFDKGYVVFIFQYVIQ